MKLFNFKDSSFYQFTICLYNSKKLLLICKIESYFASMIVCNSEICFSLLYLSKISSLDKDYFVLFIFCNSMKLLLFEISFSSSLFVFIFYNSFVLLLLMFWVKNMLFLKELFESKKLEFSLFFNSSISDFIFKI